MRKTPSYFKYTRQQSPRPHFPLELQEAATNPPVTFLRLRHSLLPWFIEVNANTSPGDLRIITIGHLLSMIHLELRRQIEHNDFYNEDVSEEDRQRITAAFTTRTRDDAEDYSKGVRRIDFLGEEFVFVGIKKRGSEWILKTQPWSSPLMA